ncbi:MAG: hypothetical protein ABJG15_04910 [Hyphomonadaceae bacterium]
MTRLCVALITALYAIAFAFLAIMAVRWPSVLAVGALLSEGAGVSADFNGLLDWRNLGLFYGGLYFFAALCFYACSTLIQRKGRGAFTAFVMGVLAGFPFLALFDFAPGWWQSPNLFEQIVIGAAGLSILLMPIISSLTPEKRLSKRKTAQAEHAASHPAIINVPAAPVNATAPLPQRPQRRRKPVPAAIARQRESFAAHGRRALAKRNR